MYMPPKQSGPRSAAAAAAGAHRPLRVLALEVQQLRDHQVGGVVVDGAAGASSEGA